MRLTRPTLILKSCDLRKNRGWCKLPARRLFMLPRFSACSTESSNVSPPIFLRALSARCLHRDFGTVAASLDVTVPSFRALSNHLLLLPFVGWCCLSFQSGYRTSKHQVLAVLEHIAKRKKGKVAWRTDLWSNTIKHMLVAGLSVKEKTF